MEDNVKLTVDTLRYCEESGARCGECPSGVGENGVPNCHSQAHIADLIESLAAELEQVKGERDAAVEDLKKNSYTPCATCGKRIDNKSCTEFGERMPCDMINIFRCEMYEWRGVKED